MSVQRDLCNILLSLSLSVFVSVFLYSTCHLQLPPWLCDYSKKKKRTPLTNEWDDKLRVIWIELLCCAVIDNLVSFARCVSEVFFLHKHKPLTNALQLRKSSICITHDRGRWGRDILLIRIWRRLSVCFSFTRLFSCNRECVCVVELLSQRWDTNHCAESLAMKVIVWSTINRGSSKRGRVGRVAKIMWRDEHTHIITYTRKRAWEEWQLQCTPRGLFPEWRSDKIVSVVAVSCMARMASSGAQFDGCVCYVRWSA